MDAVKSFSQKVFKGILQLELKKYLKRLFLRVPHIICIFVNQFEALTCTNNISTLNQCKIELKNTSVALLNWGIC